MDRIKFVFTGFFLIFLLSACSLSDLIGPISIPDVFEMDGKEITMSRQGVNALQTTASVEFEGELNIQFRDLNTGNFTIPSGLSPSKISQVAGIKAIISVSSQTSEANFPNTVSIAGSNFDITVSDEDSAAISKSFAYNSNISVTFTKQACTSASFETICQYETEIDTSGLFELDIDGTEFSAIYNGILTDGVAPNSLRGRAKIAFEGDKLIPADAEVTVTLNMQQGTLEF